MAEGKFSAIIIIAQNNCMKKILHYSFHEATDSFDLIDKVNRAILEDGWQPYGEIVVVCLPAYKYADGKEVDRAFRYIQAVVKYED